jgi:hypothetical protein
MDRVKGSRDGVLFGLGAATLLWIYLNENHIDSLQELQYLSQNAVLLRVCKGFNTHLAWELNDEYVKAIVVFKWRFAMWVKAFRLLSRLWADNFCQISGASCYSRPAIGVLLEIVYRVFIAVT